MSCATCSTTGTDGNPAGCGSNGNCSSGGCNRLNVYDWFADIPISFQDRSFNVVEVSFKQGARKGFYRNTPHLDLHRGQLVVVDAAQGFDIGEVSMTGELVKLQMKKKGVKDRSDAIRNLIRNAEEEDIQKLEAAREKEKQTMITARVIAREMELDMKIGDVEYQGDNKKATFYYTADDRVDFRELVKRYAKDFKVKIEMRQIGARQEAGRIGGIGSCGRELCCSTWLTDFNSVSTSAARYQNLSINPEKLSGQCGRLKCCLNYELDTYMDALKKIPKKADKIKTQEGVASLRKTEIFKELMWYTYENSSTIFKLKVDDVNELLAMNKKGEMPASLIDFMVVTEVEEKEDEHEDLVGQISLNTLEKHGKKRRGKSKRGKSKGGGGKRGQQNKQQTKGQGGDNQQQKKGGGGNRRKGGGGNRRHKGGGNKGGNQNQGGQN